MPVRCDSGSLRSPALLSEIPELVSSFRKRRENKQGISSVREWIELSSQGIQDLAVVIIVVSVVFGSLRFLLKLSKRVPDPYPAYKKLLGRSLLLSLEFLIAAD